MDWQAWLTLAATQVGLQFTAGLGRRWLRARRPYLLSWTIALTAITVGLGASWYGQAFGFTEPVLRLYYVAGALLAAPWLGLGEVELLSARRIGEVARIGLIGFSVVAGFVVGFEPLRGAVAGHAIPDGGRLFGGLSLALIAVSNVAGTIAVLGGIALSAWRARAGGSAARSRLAGMLGIGLGVLVFATAGTAARAGASQLQPVLLATAVAVMYAGFSQTLRRVGRHRGRRRRGDASRRPGGAVGAAPAVSVAGERRILGQPSSAHPTYRARVPPTHHRITLLSKPGCHLCDEVRAVLQRVSSDLGVPLEERDITASSADIREYGERIPVTLIDGREHDFWRVDEARLRAALAG